MSITHDFATQTQGQGHTFKASDLPCNDISWSFWTNFIKLHSKVPLSECTEQMTQLCKLKVKVTLQGHGILRWGILAVRQTAILFKLY